VELVVIVGLAAKIGISTLFLALSSASCAVAAEKGLWDELTARGSKFVQQQNMSAAEPVMKAALQEAKKNPADQLKLAKSNANLGWLYFRQGKYLESQPYFGQVLAICEKSQDAELTRSAVAVVEALAFMDLRQGKFREAESLYTGLTGATAPIVKFSGLLGRCNVLAWQGRYADARQLLTQCQSEISRLMPPPALQGNPHDPGELAKMTRQTLMSSFATVFKKRLSFDLQVAQGNLFLSEGSLEQAESCFHKACDQFKKDFGREAPAIVLGYMGSGKTLLAQGKLADAQNSFQIAKTILERESAQERPFLEDCQIYIADIQARRGHYAEAQSSLNLTRAGLEKNLGADTVPVSDCWLGLANAARIGGKTEEAEADYRKSLSLKEKLFGSDSDKLGPVLNPLAELLEKQGNEGEARQLYARSIDAYEKRSLAGNLQACQAMVGLAGLEKKQGNLDKAEKLYRKALSPLEQTLPPGDPCLIDTYKMLGEIYLAQNKMAEAESVFKSEVGNLDQMSRQDENLVVALNGLATAILAQQKWSDAERKLARILTLVENHPQLQGGSSSVLKNYPEVLRKLNRESEAAQISERLSKIGVTGKSVVPAP
jgi:tetratricopeptide (TPR) repeat protein